jgi:hypothetical protein
MRNALNPTHGFSNQTVDALLLERHSLTTKFRTATRAKFIVLADYM